MGARGTRAISCERMCAALMRETHCENRSPSNRQTLAHLQNVCAQNDPPSIRKTLPTLKTSVRGAKARAAS
eukprot:8828258-Pyramimonas_sp.AAC.1